MEENLQKYFKTFSSEVRSLVEKILCEREQYGVPTYESTSRLMEVGVEEDADMLIGIAYYYLAECYLEEGDVEKGSLNLTSCINYLQGTGPYLYMVKAYNLLGTIMLSQDNVVMALEIYNNAMQCSREHNLQYEQAMMMTNTAVCYQHIHKNEEAIAFYDKARKQYERVKEGPFFTRNRMINITNRGILLLLLDRIEEVEEDVFEVEDYITKKDNFRTVESVTFMTAYHWKRGNKEETEKYITVFIEILPDAKLLYCNDSVEQFMDILVQMEKFEVLQEAIRIILPSIDIVKNSTFFLQVMKMRLLYGSHYESMLSLREEIKNFFSVYDNYQITQGAANAKMYEMRKQLSNIQAREYELKLLNQQLLRSAKYDDLTQLPNRGYLNQVAEDGFEKAQRQGKTMGICFLDIDYFKQLNDFYGHLRGDECLIQIASLLESVLVSDMFAARYGGDEFVLLFYNMETKEIESILKDIQKKIKQLEIPNQNAKISNVITVSMGCFNKVPKGGNRLWDFFARADRILYKVKENGRNNYKIEEKF